MKSSAWTLVVATFVSGSTLSGCGDEGGDATVACRLDSFNQCLEWINLSDSQVDSLKATCTNDDGGEVIAACPTENIVGTCEDSGGREPDSLNHFYLPTGQDPATYAASKQQACESSGGVWNPA
jgi:hypothetical protein